MTDHTDFVSSPCNRRTFTRRAAGAALAALGLLGRAARGQEPAERADDGIRVLVWSEGTAPKAVYPQGINGTIAEDLNRRPGVIATTARLDDPEAGLAEDALDAADVLVWWGRLRHDDVPDDRAEAVAARVRAGRLGLIALHASFASKPFQALMGMPCVPGAWSEDGRPEHVAIQAPQHPIAQGVRPFVIPQSAMFAEPFTVPEPEAVVCVSSWESGETFRSVLTWTVDNGRVVYFRPGHDGFPVLFHPAVRQILANSAHWAARRV